jgi:hypothetical protein
MRIAQTRQQLQVLVVSQRSLGLAAVKTRPSRLGDALVWRESVVTRNRRTVLGTMAGVAIFSLLQDRQMARLAEGRGNASLQPDVVITDKTVFLCKPENAVELSLPKVRCKRMVFMFRTQRPRGMTLFTQPACHFFQPAFLRSHRQD